MRIGISLTSNYPAVADPRLGARWMVERTAAARRAGLDSLFVGDQHASPTPYYQNTPILGRLLAEWGEAPAGCLFLLPLWHPVLVAEQIGTLAAIAQGPFIMQCGLGWGKRRWAPISGRAFGFEEARHRRRLLAAKRSVPRGGSAYRSKVRRRPSPSRSGSGRAPPPSTARRGWPRVVASPGLTTEEVQAQADLYRERCTAYGKEPGAVVLRRDIYVGESSSDAQQVLQQALGTGYRGMPAEALIAGTVDDVTEQLRGFGKLGYTYILVRHLTNDQSKILGSLERLAQVRAALAQS